MVLSSLSHSAVVILLTGMALCSAVLFALLVLERRRRGHIARVLEQERDLRAAQAANHELEREVRAAEREIASERMREAAGGLLNGAGQSLSVAALKLSHAFEERPRESLLEARTALGQGVEEVRAISSALRHEERSRAPLPKLLERDAERITRVGRVRASVECLGAVPRLSEAEHVLLYRSCQEALVNALRHSGTDALRVSVDARGPLAIAISDNGRGIQADRIGHAGGIAAMKRRCALIGYRAEVRTSEGTGTVCSIVRLAPGEAAAALGASYHANGHDRHRPGQRDEQDLI